MLQAQRSFEAEYILQEVTSTKCFAKFAWFSPSPLPLWKISQNASGMAVESMHVPLCTCVLHKHSHKLHIHFTYTRIDTEYTALIRKSVLCTLGLWGYSVGLSSYTVVEPVNRSWLILELHGEIPRTADSKVRRKPK